MALSTVTVVWDETDIGQAGLNGSVRFAPNTTWTDTLGGTVIEPQPLTFPILDSAGESVPLVANDSAGLSPSGSYYVITVQIAGLPPRQFNAYINVANGSTQTLGSLNPLFPVPALIAYVPITGGTMTGDLNPAVVQLTDAATIAVNAAAGNDFRVTLGGDRTLGAPSGPVDGQKIIVQVTQDATGGRTLAYASAYEFSTGLPSPSLSAGAGVTDLLGFAYNGAKVKWLFVAFVNGFS